MFDQIGFTTKIEKWMVKIIRGASTIAREKKNGMYILDDSIVIVHASILSEAMIKQSCDI